jgi:hypothetical protein
MPFWKLQLPGSEEAGASLERFPSWSLGTRERVGAVPKLELGNQGTRERVGQHTFLKLKLCVEVE